MARAVALYLFATSIHSFFSVKESRKRSKELISKENQNSKEINIINFSVSNRENYITQ
jgi:hypothetical protein